MSTPVERILGEVLDELRTCLCTAMEATTGGRPCFCGIVPGKAAIADRCGCGDDGCGQAWVRLDRIFPTVTFPQPAAAAPCSSGLAAVIETGVYRCVTVSGPHGQAPTLEQQINDSLNAVSDAGALAAAIKCCDAITTRKHALGTYLPSDSGGCGGGTWPVTVLLTPSVVRA